MDFIYCLTADNWINIIGIGVNALLGGYLAIILTKRISDRRAMKNYFISEADHVREAYREFLNGLLSNRKNCNQIKSWFQVMNIRLTNFETAYKENIRKKGFDAKELNIKLREIVTDHDDFNNSFKKEFVKVSPGLKQEIFKIHGELSKSLLDTVVSINNR